MRRPLLCLRPLPKHCQTQPLKSQQRLHQSLRRLFFRPAILRVTNLPWKLTYIYDQILTCLFQYLERHWGEQQDFYACWQSHHLLQSSSTASREDFRGPDFFVVLGAERTPRKSWVVWEEDGKYPNLIVELLSDSTATTDRKLKKQIYQDIFRTPDYFWFDPHTLEFQGFHLVDGTYQDLHPNPHGWLWSEQLQLFLGVHNQQLRFFTPEGQLVASPEEAEVACGTATQ
jgi:hypothetical protein